MNPSFVAACEIKGSHEIFSSLFLYGASCTFWPGKYFRCNIIKYYNKNVNGLLQGQMLTKDLTKDRNRSAEDDSFLKMQ